MVAERTETRPYAAPSNIISVIARSRTRNVPDPISNEFLKVAGVPDAALGRVGQALRFLNLADESMHPTDYFRALAVAPDAQYRDLFTQIIRKAYRTDFEVIDPEKDSQAKIIDAFRPYQPRSQTARMVMLFLGLCRAAGMKVAELSREASSGDRTKRPVPVGAARKTGSRRVGNEINFSTKDKYMEPMSVLLFGVTEEDIAALEENEFQEVWNALGKVARARARAKESVQRQLSLTISSPSET